MFFLPLSAAGNRSISLVAAALLMGSVSGCVTTEQQADGSTLVRVKSINDALGLKPANQPTSMVQPTAARPSQVASAPTAGSIKNTKLSGLFAQHPFDGTHYEAYPRVAVTVTDWSRSDCWNAKAVLWWSAKKSEPVGPFSVCWKQSLGFALNNAAGLHQFMGQSTFSESSGNVRTNGPKPPMIAVPDQQPLSESQAQQDFTGFVSQLIRDTGWQAGRATNMWIVEYKKQ